jgi:hypothetical protein
MIMAVLMVNARLGVRVRQVAATDPHGFPTPTGWGPAGTLLPGRVQEDQDGLWRLGVDPGLWPVRQGDLVVDDTGTTWLVATADLLRNNVDPRVDWIRVTARERVAGGTEPGGPVFAGTP